MSGTYRITLGPGIKYLRDRVEIAKTLMGEERTDQNVNDLRKELVRVRQTYRRLEDTMKEWQNYIINLTHAQQVPEQLLFDNFKSEDKHFTDWLEEGRQAIVDLELEIAEAESNGSSVDSRASNDQAENIGEGDNEFNETVIANPPPANPPRTVHRNQRRNNFEPNLPVHLPKLSLPTFAGNPLNWPAFWQSFSANVDSLQVPAVQKFSYLLSYLKGDALANVSGYAVTAENYPLVLETLKKEYGDTKIIREALQSELINLSSPSNNAQSLHTFAQSVERICRQLRNLNHPDNDPFMLMTIKSKLPRQALADILRAEKTEQGVWKVDDLRKGLLDYVSLQAEIDRCTHSGRKEPQQSSPNHKNDFKKTSGSVEKSRNFAMVSKGKSESTPDIDETRNLAMVQIKGYNAKNRSPPPCCFCTKAHWASDCNNVRDRATRVKILSEQGRCHLCLRKEHKSPECKSGKNCRICNGRHHQCICFKAFQTTGQKQSNPKKQGQKTFSNSDKKPEKAQTNMVTIDEAKVNSSVVKPRDNLLMTVEATILARQNPEKAVKALLFFDPGSQISFMRNDLVDELGPPRVGENTLDVHSALVTKPTRIRTPQFLVQIKLNNGETEDIVVHRQNWLNTTLECADMKTGELRMLDKQPDILISIGEFWKFFRGLEEISPYFYRIHTSVGPIICGKKPANPQKEGTGSIAAITATIIDKEPVPPPEAINLFWELEALGIKDNPKENDDETAMELFNKTIKNIDGRYQVS